MVLVRERIEQPQDVVLVVWVVVAIELVSAYLSEIQKLTRFRIATSILLWFRYAGLFLTTLTAQMECVRMFWHLTTWPNVPWPRTSRIK